MSDNIVTRKLIGEECDGTLTYNHLCNYTEDPTPVQYKKMLKAAKQDKEKLDFFKQKHIFNNGKGRYDIGLPYIELI
jgi:hypothetical protein